MYPQDYRYTKEHEWIQVEGKRGTVGITHFAQEKLGDIVYVELPAVGSHFGAMESLGTVESVKAVSDIYSPVAGKVVEVNTALAENPALVNQDPHGRAWLAKLELDDAGAVSGLLTAEQYEKFVHEEAEA